MEPSKLLQIAVLTLAFLAWTTPGPLATSVPTSIHPLAAFTYVPCVACALPGYAVFFNANTSFPLPSIKLYTWDFGDGSALLSTTSPSTSHIFTNFVSPGQWQVTLTVQDSSGQTDTVNQQVVFNILPRFTFVPAHPMVGQPVVLNGTSTIIYQSPPGPAGFAWNFGDGTTGLGPIVKHVYSQTGSYRITITVLTDTAKAQVSKTIVVVSFVPGSELVSNFIFDQTNVTVYATFTLNQTSRTLTGTVTVTAANATTGDLIFAKSFNITVTFTPGGTVRFILGIPTSPLWLASNCAVNTVRGQASCFISRDPDLTRTGNVNVIDFGVLAYHFGAMAGSPGYDPALDLAASGSIGVIDAGIMAMDFGAPVYY